MSWTPEQIKNVNDHQNSGHFHPYTCCNHQTMVATVDGLKCPKCGTVQTDVMDSVLNGSLAASLSAINRKWNNPPNSVNLTE
jgi:hypothetical protein